LRPTLHRYVPGQDGPVPAAGFTRIARRNAAAEPIMPAYNASVSIAMIAKPGQSGNTSPMRYEPGMRLLRLAILLSGSRTGLSLDEMAAHLEISRRSVERLRDRLEDVFPALHFVDGEDRTRRWMLPRDALPALPAQPGAIATLETLARDLSAKGDAGRAADLRDAAATLRAMMPPTALRRAEPDIEALMQAEGSAAHPGPRLNLDRALLTNLRHAILGMNKLALRYRPAASARAPHRVLCPYAILYGHRAYLVAHTDTTSAMRLWRIDRISDVEILPDRFDRQDFDLAAYAAQSFGVFQEPPQDVVLKFTPQAAEDAINWIFHPTQRMEAQEDGSLIVRFRCGGMLELSWHLVTWGDSVNIMKLQ
jgi:predicted DNA-binding transcriptional regulator YafY